MIPGAMVQASNRSRQHLRLSIERYASFIAPNWIPITSAVTSGAPQQMEVDALHASLVDGKNRPQSMLTKS